MATTGSVVVEYTVHPNVAAMSADDQELVKAAHAAALRAYAPYSKFKVGAALRASDGRVITGSNQENASFPAGICAERTALHAAMAQDPGTVITTMAVIVPQVTGERPVSPCGICRQALLEQEARQDREPLRLLMAVENGPVFELRSASALLPLSFDASFLNG
ncbi:MAG: cytidine deaminase [Flavobacteriales bacterium]|nr:cytidine deaminase [Flavobacteriales bacterium]HRH70373.1 cytidine deaminase [Flavobacteriales bacterium]